MFFLIKIFIIAVTTIFSISFSLIPINKAYADDLENLIPGLLRDVEVRPGFIARNLFPAFIFEDALELAAGINEDLETGATIASGIGSSIGSSIGSEIAVFPLSSPGGGVTYKYDPEADIFVRSKDSLGPILSERPVTIGKGNIAVGSSYTYLDFDTFNGGNLRDLDFSIPVAPTPRTIEIGPGGIIKITDPRLGAALRPNPEPIIMELDLKEVRSNIISFYGTYGLTEKLDISLLIPAVDNSISAGVRLSTNFGDLATNRLQARRLGRQVELVGRSEKDDATGIGDILLRAKYNVFNIRWFDFTTGVNITIPTGEEDDFLGTGRFGAEPFFVFGKTFDDIWDPISLQVTPRLNLAYKYDNNAIGEDRFSYVAGFDAGFNIGRQQFTFVSDFLGKHVIGEGDNTGDDLTDVSIGLKYSPPKKLIGFVFANVLIPVDNDKGLRSDTIYTGGFELSL